MNRPRPSLWMIGALCLALLVLRVGGVHLHLCFDGSEPPLSYHVVDSGIHHLDEHGAGESHSDRDMSVADDVAVKKPTNHQDATLALFAFAVLLFLLTQVRPARSTALTAPPLTHLISWLRPPLRGPPSPA